MPQRRRFLATMAALAATAGTGAHAAGYPDKPIRLVVSTTPGSSPDTIARLLAQGMAERMGQPLIVDNRGGANGMIATELVFRAPPDGYTLLLTTGATLSTNPALHTNAPGRNILGLLPVTQVASSDLVLAANSSSSVKSIGDFVHKARSEPGKLDVATTAQGSFAWLIAELLKQSAGLDFLTVAYNGGGPTMTAFLGNQTEFIVELTTLVAPSVKGGKAVPLATTGLKRSPDLPDVPTLAESGFPDMNVTAWFGLAAPPGTPAALVDAIQGHAAAVLARQDIRARLAGLSAVPIASTPAQFAATLADERRKWKRVIVNSKIQIE